MKHWQFIGKIVTNGDPVLLNGLSPWEHDWISTNEESIVIHHPYYPSQKHPMDIYEISDGLKVVQFGASEFSNCAWGFYLPVEK